MADTGTDFQGLPPAGALQPDDVVPIQRGTGEDSTLRTTIADILANAGSGAQTGDLLLTVRAPEGDWLSQDSVYLQADYPELFDLVGLLPDAPPGRLWTAGTSPGVFVDVCRVTDKISVAVGNNTVWRSTDVTATWTAIPVTGFLSSVAVLNGALIACGPSGVILRSTDLGVTWTAIASGTTQTLNKVLVMSQNVVLVTGAGGTVRRSADAGLTWGAVTGSFGGNGLSFGLRFSPLVAVIYASGGIASYWRTLDAGATWTTLTFPSFGSAQPGAVFDAMTAAIPGSGGNWLRTINQGETWTLTTVSGMPGNSAMIRVNSRRAVWPGGAGNGFITDDAALTWTSLGSVPGRFGALLSDALIMAWAGSGTAIQRSRAEYAYDTATMFKTPMVGDVRGYIKP